MTTRVITGLVFTLTVIVFLAPARNYPFMPVAMFIIVSLIAGNELYQAIRKRISFNLAGYSFYWRLSIIFPAILIYLLNKTSYFNLLLPGNVGVDTESLNEFNGVAAAKNSLTALLIVIGFYLVFCLVSFLFMTIFAAMNHGTKVLAPILYVNCAGLYLAFPIAIVAVILYLVPAGYVWLYLAVLIPWISDTFAYFSGYFFGKRKLIPHISPKKTIVGFWGGLSGAVLISGFMLTIYQNKLLGIVTLSTPMLWLLAVIIGGLLGISSQLGDWIASVIKRELDIKDFGHLLPGHGGILDRFDSVFFTLPAVLVIIILQLLKVHS